MQQKNQADAECHRNIATFVAWPKLRCFTDTSASRSLGSDLLLLPATNVADVNSEYPIVGL
jgi:hypothetical protein